MRILYDCLLERHITDEQAVAAAANLETARLGLRAESDHSLGSSAIRLTAGEAHAVLRLRKLSAPEFSSLVEYGEYDRVCEFAVFSLTPENVGLCWDALIVTVLTLDCPVWLSSETYGRDAISPHAEVRVAQLSGSFGHILEPNEFMNLAGQ